MNRLHLDRTLRTNWCLTLKLFVFAKKLLFFFNAKFWLIFGSLLLFIIFFSIVYEFETHEIIVITK